MLKPNYQMNGLSSMLSLMNPSVQQLLDERTDIQQKMQDPEVYGDQKQMKKLGKRLSYLDDIAQWAEQYEKAEKSINDATELLKDDEMQAMAEQEIKEAKSKKEEAEQKIEELLNPPDPMEERDVILEVRAGTGGEEAALFAAELLRMYLRYAEERGWETELLDKADADAGGIKEASVRIAGDNTFGTLRYEGGVHRVQRIPETEAKGRVHTSTATVAVMPEAEEEDIEIKNEDLRIDTFRAGGAGGQHVNKTDSAVRITHVPTGVAVACQSERSQLQNRERCMMMLRSRLLEAEMERKAQEEGSLRSKQVGSALRSEKIRTYNFPQDRLTDHRLGQNFSNLPAIMEGDIQKMIDALREWAREESNAENQ